MAEFTFRLILPLMSKARPRAGRGFVYLPPLYRAWQTLARAELRRIWMEQGMETLKACEISVEIHGPGRGDADNVIGALLDAGLPDRASGWSGAWADDRVTVVPFIACRWIRDRQQFWDVTIAHHMG